MARLLIHVEGQTEEDFVNEVLRDHLLAKGYEERTPSPAPRGDSEEPAAFVTTMVDYYRLPQDGAAAWPGRAKAGHLPTYQKAERVEEALGWDVVTEMGKNSDSRRFVPFVVMHEFEGLLFSDCAAFTHGIGRPDLEAAFGEIRSQFASPEDINDSPDTAPSKRVENLIPGYEKPLFGTLGILEIGLSRIRAECPHFDRWLAKLESLVP